MTIFRPLVLCYHAVSDRWEHPLAVSADTLVGQVRRALAVGYRPVDATGLLDNRRRSLHVSFDDAFCSLTDVLPHLQRLGVSMSVFACSSYADGGAVFDVPELAADAESQPGELATLAWEDLRRLADEGIEIGSHTVGHPHLTRCTDAELRAELQDSRLRFEDELARPCRFLSYPYGEEDRRVRAAARDVGYEAAFALPGRLELDIYALPRVGIYRDDGVLRSTLKSSLTVRRALGSRRSRDAAR